MPGNQWRTELMFGVGNGKQGTIVPSPRSTEYPSKPLMYDANQGPEVTGKFFASPFGVATWRSGTYVPENGFIYCFPFGITATPIKIDPVNETVTSFSLAAGGQVYWGSCRAPNGSIYAVPSAATTTTVGKIDPATDTFTKFGALGAVGNKYERCVLAPNGNIYGVPSSSTTVLKIDTSTDTATTFGSVGAGTFKWSGGVLALNGKIYCVPYNSDSILVIDPSTDTATTFGSTLSFMGNNQTTNRWSCGTLAPDGKIYCFPYNAKNVLIIDPETNTLSSFPFSFFYGGGGGNNTTASSLSSQFGSYYTETLNPTAVIVAGQQGGTLSANGRLYAGPAYAAAATDARIAITEIDPLARTTTLFRTPDFNLFPYSQTGTAPYLTSVLCPDGSIICIASAGGNPFFKISGLPVAAPDMYTMPTNLAGNLATSAYNRHVNK